MDSMPKQPDPSAAAELMKLLVAIEANGARTNELLYATLNREQRQSFDLAFPDQASGAKPSSPAAGAPGGARN
jgi:hypothetical protein